VSPLLPLDFCELIFFQPPRAPGFELLQHFFGAMFKGSYHNMDVLYAAADGMYPPSRRRQCSSMVFSTIWRS